MKHIFIAEDNYADAVLLREAMREAGVDADFDVVEDGERAIQRLRTLAMANGHGPHLPDLIVLDLNLPRVRGHEILDFIRHDRQLCHVHTVVVTSSNAQRDRDRCSGADGYFLKCSDWDDCVKLAHSLAGYLD